jgi:hypothetical protein
VELRVERVWFPHDIAAPTDGAIPAAVARIEALPFDLVETDPIWPPAL